MFDRVRRALLGDESHQRHHERVAQALRQSVGGVAEATTAPGGPSSSAGAVAGGQQHPHDAAAAAAEIRRLQIKARADMLSEAQRKRAAREYANACTMVWLQAIFPRFEELRSLAEVGNRWWCHPDYPLPEVIRPEVWKRAIGNASGLQPLLFDVCLAKHVDRRRRLGERSRQPLAAATLDDGAAGGCASPVATALSPARSTAMRAELEGPVGSGYFSRVTGKDEMACSIGVDVPRTLRAVMTRDGWSTSCSPRQVNRQRRQQSEDPDAQRTLATVPSTSLTAVAMFTPPSSSDAERSGPSQEAAGEGDTLRGGRDATGTLLDSTACSFAGPSPGCVTAVQQPPDATTACCRDCQCRSASPFSACTDPRLAAGVTAPPREAAASGEDVEDLLEMLLNAFLELRPDIGYVQGMSYLASTLLECYGTPLLLAAAALPVTTVSPATPPAPHRAASRSESPRRAIDDAARSSDYALLHDAFVSLGNLITQGHFPHFYTMNNLGMSAYIRVYEEVLKRAAPAVARAFTISGIVPQLYVVDWWMSLFARMLPIDLAFRCWDLFLYHPAMLFRMTAALIVLHEGALAAACAPSPPRHHHAQDAAAGSLHASFFMLIDGSEDCIMTLDGAMSVIRNIGAPREKAGHTAKPRCGNGSGDGAAAAPLSFEFSVFVFLALDPRGAPGGSGDPSATAKHHALAQQFIATHADSSSRRQSHGNGSNSNHHNFLLASSPATLGGLASSSASAGDSSTTSVLTPAAAARFAWLKARRALIPTLDEIDSLLRHYYGGDSTSSLR